MGNMAEGRAAVDKMLKLRPDITVASIARTAHERAEIFVKRAQILIRGLRSAGLPEG
jgi:hypothetical protein